MCSFVQIGHAGINIAEMQIRSRLGKLIMRIPPKMSFA
jgi:hypothetical protein